MLDERVHRRTIPGGGGDDEVSHGGTVGGDNKGVMTAELARETDIERAPSRSSAGISAIV